MESLLQDLRFGCRILLRSPAISLAVVVALTLGIGANSAMFSIVDALLLHPFPFSRSLEQLMLIQDRDAQGARVQRIRGGFHRLAQTNEIVFRSGGLVAGAELRDDRRRPALQIAGATVTTNFFRTLGVKPALGRTFLPDEDGIDNPGGGIQGRHHQIPLVAGQLRRRSQYSGAPIKLDSTPYAIVGVMAPDFQFLWRNYQAWIPITLDRDESRLSRSARDRTIESAARNGAAAELRGWQRAGRTISEKQ